MTTSPLSIALMLFQSCLEGTSNLGMDRTILFYLPSGLRNPQSLYFFEIDTPRIIVMTGWSRTAGAATRNRSDHRFLEGADCGAIKSLQLHSLDRCI